MSMRTKFFGHVLVLFVKREFKACERDAGTLIDEPANKRRRVGK